MKCASSLALAAHDMTIHNAAPTAARTFCLYACAYNGIQNEHENVNKTKYIQIKPETETLRALEFE